MRLAFFSTFTPEFTFAEACALAARLGYEGVQPRVAPGAPYDPAKPLNPWGNNRCTIPEDAFLRNPQEALKPAQAAGLVVTSLPSYCGVGDPERAARLVKACAAAGIPGMRLGPLPLPAAGVVDVNALIRDSQRLYRQVLETARPAGVKLNIELHMGGMANSPAAALRILEPFDPREVGVIYDPGNMVYEGHEPARVSVGALGPYLAEVHVKNGRWVHTPDKPAGQRWHCESAPLDDGVADWGNIVSTLKAAGFAGWLIEEGELHAQGIASDQRLGESIRLLRGWLAA
jgi:sugar phosphate isomerase/epimerase